MTQRRSHILRLILKRIAHQAAKFEPDEVEEIDDEDYRLGEDTSNGGQLIYSGDIVVGDNRNKISYHEWINRFGKQADYNKYLQFFFKTRIVKVPELRILVGKEILEDYKNAPEPLVVNPGFSLATPGEAVFLYGETNVGKSTIAADIVRKAGLRTLYIATEHRDVAGENFSKMADFDLDKIMLMKDKPYASQIDDICKRMDDFGTELIVMDVASPYLGNENDADNVNQKIEALEQLIRNRYFLVVHHAGKNADSGLRGSTRLEQFCERSILS